VIRRRRVAGGRQLAVVVPFYETGSGLPVPLLTIAWAF
jgi:hypothetical protein